MKKLLLIAALVASYSTQAKKLYIKAGAGFAAPFATQSQDNGYPMNGNITYNSVTGKLQSFEVKPASMNAGVQMAIGVGLTLSKNLSVELNAISGIKTKHYAGTMSYPHSSGVYVSEKYTMYSKMPVLLNPSITVKSGDGFEVYGRAGLLLPVKAKIMEEMSGTYGFGRSESIFEYKTSLNIGYSGAIGISFPIIKHTNLWIEANFNSLSLYVKEREMTSYSVNGNDKLNSVSAENKLVTYERSGAGAVRPTYSVPFSNVTGLIGLSIVL